MKYANLALREVWYSFLSEQQMTTTKKKKKKNAHKKNEKIKNMFIHFFLIGRATLMIVPMQKFSILIKNEDPIVCQVWYIYFLLIPNFGTSNVTKISFILLYKYNISFSMHSLEYIPT